MSYHSAWGLKNIWFMVMSYVLHSAGSFIWNYANSLTSLEHGSKNTITQNSYACTWNHCCTRYSVGRSLWFYGSGSDFFFKVRIKIPNFNWAYLQDRCAVPDIPEPVAGSALRHGPQLCRGHHMRHVCLLYAQNRDDYKVCTCLLRSKLLYVSVCPSFSDLVPLSITQNRLRMYVTFFSFVLNLF